MPASTPPAPAPPAPAAVPLLPGLSALAGEFDLLLCDVWGVLHDGERLHAGAADALARFRAGGGGVVLVSNAPRPAGAVLPQLDALSLPRAAYDALVTSGDVSRALVEAAGGPVHHLGPPRDRPLFEGLTRPGGGPGGPPLAGPLLVGPGEAVMVVCTGLDDDDAETAEDYRGRLEGFLARDLPMVCANPDLVVERGGRLVPCAGAVADLYERMGGRVTWAGKPHRPIYERALAAAGRAPGDVSRVLAVGDALRTDVAGAAAVGVPALFVAAGIHAPEVLVGGAIDGARLGALLAPVTGALRGAVTRLVW